MVRYGSKVTENPVAMVTSVCSTPVDDAKYISLRRLIENMRSFDMLGTDLLSFQETFFVEQLMKSNQPMPTFKYPVESP